MLSRSRCFLGARLARRPPPRSKAAPKPAAQPTRSRTLPLVKQIKRAARSSTIRAAATTTSRNLRQHQKVLKTRSVSPRRSSQKASATATRTSTKAFPAATVDSDVNGDSPVSFHNISISLRIPDALPVRSRYIHPVDFLGSSDPLLLTPAEKEEAAAAKAQAQEEQEKTAAAAAEAAEVVEDEAPPVEEVRINKRKNLASPNSKAKTVKRPVKAATAAKPTKPAKPSPARKRKAVSRRVVPPSRNLRKTPPRTAAAKIRAAAAALKKKRQPHTAKKTPVKRRVAAPRAAPQRPAVKAKPKPSSKKRVWHVMTKKSNKKTWRQRK